MTAQKHRKEVEIMSNEQNKICFCRNLVRKKCRGCGEERTFLNVEGKEHLLTWEMVEKIKEIISSNQSGYEKRIALFDFLESLEVGELPTQEKKRVDYLLQSRLYSELAKQSMKEYKKLTVENFSRTD